MTDKLALPSKKYIVQSVKVGNIIDLGPGYTLAFATHVHNSASECLLIFEIDPSVPVEVSPAPRPYVAPSPTAPAQATAPPPGPQQAMPLGKRP